MNPNAIVSAPSPTASWSISTRPIARCWRSAASAARVNLPLKVVPPEMVAFLAAGERAMNAARDALALATRLGADGARERGLARRAESVRLRAPVPRPTKFILVGLNYRDHAEEAGFKIPEVPTFFSKYANCVIGPGDAIKIPKVSAMIDYEGEYAFVIGRAGRDIPPERAMEYVAGYTIVNDVSCRDYQLKTGQWMIGKTFDTFAPMGPYLVTRDEIADPHNLEISLYLNGQRMQHSNTRNLIFKTGYLIAFLSQVFTFEPGDVVSTGTPAGVGYARKPPVFMKAGRPGADRDRGSGRAGEPDRGRLAAPSYRARRW